MIEIIAEIGVNHDGSPAKAQELVRTARRCGADTAKFQTFKASNLVTGTATTAEYQKKHHAGDQLSMLRRLELEPDDFRLLVCTCRDEGIRFLSTPFDLESLDFLLGLPVDTIKIGSGELTNAPLLAAIGRGGVRVILSTGMACLGEVETALDVLREHGARDIALLHCVTQYPTPVDQVNLRAMGTLRQAFALPVGYSDHTQGNEVAIAAAALGATILEKHLTLDPAAPGPDHAASSSPAEFAALVRAVRNVEACLGDGVKRPAPCEVANMPIARKSLVATRDLAAGDVVRSADVTVKRPGDGIAPEHATHVVGLCLARPVKQDTVLLWDDFHHA